MALPLPFTLMRFDGAEEMIITNVTEPAASNDEAAEFDDDAPLLLQDVYQSVPAAAAEDTTVVSPPSNNTTFLLIKDIDTVPPFDKDLTLEAQPRVSDADLGRNMLDEVMLGDATFASSPPLTDFEAGDADSRCEMAGKETLGDATFASSPPLSNFFEPPGVGADFSISENPTVIESTTVSESATVTDLGVSVGANVSQAQPASAVSVTAVTAKDDQGVEAEPVMMKIDAEAMFRDKLRAGELLSERKARERVLAWTKDKVRSAVGTILESCVLLSRFPLLTQPLTRLQVSLEQAIDESLKEHLDLHEKAHSIRLLFELEKTAALRQIRDLCPRSATNEQDDFYMSYGGSNPKQSEDVGEMTMQTSKKRPRLDSELLELDSLVEKENEPVKSPAKMQRKFVTPEKAVAAGKAVAVATASATAAAAAAAADPVVAAAK